MILCSLARNPDGTLVRPTAYEINHAQVTDALYASAAVLAVGLLFAIGLRRRPAARASAW
jgi:surface polysaccharide O-acyltransferase-like enzyme